MANITVNPVNQISVRVGPGNPPTVQSTATFTGPSQAANIALIAAEANNSINIAELAYSQANAAFDLANTISNSGVDVYARGLGNAAFLKANSAGDFANGAFDLANTLVSSSVDAFARERANAAYNQANSAAANANSVYAYANTIYANSNSIYTYSSTVVYPQANLAFARANAAFDKANSAAAFANGAFTSSNTKLNRAGDTMLGDLGMTGNIIPTAANVYFLGSKSKPWHSVYVGPGSVDIDGIVLSNTDGALIFTSNTGDSINLSGSANGSYNQANAAYDAQNTTAIFANAAYAKANSDGNFANAAFVTANSAAIFANSAFVVANAAASFANGAFVAANSAAIFANGAFFVANSAASFANGAFISANSGAIFANNAYSKANSAANFANAAFSVANTGGTSASWANAAFTQANSAFNQANSAASFANGAFALANTLVTSSVDTYARNTANSAFDKANSAASFANGAFTQANTTSSTATSAASFANGAFVTANSAASFANGSFLKANSAGDFANGAFALANTLASSSVDTYARKTANAAFTQANTGKSNLVNGSYTSQLYANGNLSVPNSLLFDISQAQITQPSPGILQISAGNSLATDNTGIYLDNAGQAAIYSYSSVLIETNEAITPHDFVFNQDGTLELPGTLYVANDIRTQSGQYLAISSDTSSEINWQGSSVPNSPVYAGASFDNSNGVTIATAMTDPSNSYIYRNWYFGYNGNLIFPDSTSQNTAFIGYATDNVARDTANSAFDKANTALPAAGGTISGSLTIQHDLSVQGNVSFTGNATSYQITGNTGQFFGYSSNGFNALYAGIPVGYLVEPQMVTQLTSNYNGYSGLNMQNINTGPYASFDMFITADNGTPNDGYLDIGLGSSTYNYGDPYTIIKPNDGYFFVNGNTVTGGGNTIIGSLQNDIVFAAGGNGALNDGNELLRINSSNNIIFKGNLISTTVANVALGHVSNVHIYGGSVGQILKTDGSGNINFIDNAGNSAFIQANSSYNAQNITAGFANSAFTQANTAISNALAYSIALG